MKVCCFIKLSTDTTL